MLSSKDKIERLRKTFGEVNLSSNEHGCTVASLKDIFDLEPVRSPWSLLGGYKRVRLVPIQAVAIGQEAACSALYDELVKEFGVVPSDLKALYRIKAIPDQIDRGVDLSAQFEVIDRLDLPHAKAAACYLIDVEGIFYMRAIAPRRVMPAKDMGFALKAC